MFQISQPSSIPSGSSVSVAPTTKASFVVPFGPLAPTATMDLFCLEAGTKSTRIRKIVLLNIGQQTTSALRQLLLVEKTTAGSGGVATALALDPTSSDTYGGVARVGNTTVGTNSQTLLTIPVVPPTAIAQMAPIVVYEDLGDGACKPIIFNNATGPLGVALEHPGATGAADVFGYVVFTEE